MNKILLFFVLAVIFTSCNSDFTARQDGYFKMEFPEHEYTKFEEPGYPYSFEYPIYAKIVKDSTIFDDDQQNPYWLNIVFPDFNGKIYISYKKIGGTSVYQVKTEEGKYRDSTGKNDFDKLVADAYNLAFKNDIKAYAIEDSLMKTPNDITGIYFQLSGNVATANQFFLTDSTNNFLRGALYFDATPNEDSLKPVNRFLREDMMHLINTLRWK